MSRTKFQILPGLTTFVLAILVCEAISLFFVPVIFPGPAALVERMIAIYSDPASYLVVARSLSRVFAGFIISMLVGTAFGLVMGLKRNVELFFDSWIMVLLTVPAVCWAFLSVLWFGISEAAPIFTIVLIVFPFVVMNIWEGTKALDKNLLEMGAVYRANRYLLLRKVLVPQLMPYNLFLAADRALVIVEDRIGCRGVRREQRCRPRVDQLVPGYAGRYDARLGRELHDRDGFDRPLRFSFVGTSRFCLAAPGGDLSDPNMHRLSGSRW